MSGRIGSLFDDFLKEEGIYDAVTDRAMERVRAREQGRSAPLHEPSADHHPDSPDDEA